MSRFVSESVQSNERILIVNNGMPALTSQLKHIFEQYGAAVQITPALPPHHHRFHRIFLLNAELQRNESLNPRSRVAQILLLPYNQKLKESHGHTRVRRICVSQDRLEEEGINRMLWYSLSDDASPYLDLRTRVFHRPRQLTHKHRVRPVSMRSYAGAAVIGGALIIMLGFLAPLIWATHLHTRLLTRAIERDQAQQRSEEDVAFQMTSIAQILYLPARPIYSLFSISLLTDNYLRLNIDIHRYFEIRRTIAQDGQSITSWIQSPTQAERATIHSRLDSLGTSYLQLSQIIENIRTTLPKNEQTISLHSTLFHEEEIAKKVVQAIPLLKGFLNLSEKQSILVIVTDSNRLRGIGGTIQSIGLLTGPRPDGWKSQFFSAQELSAPSDLQQLSSILTTYAPADATILQDASLSVDLYDLKDKLLTRIPHVSAIGKPTVTVLLTTSGIQTLLASFPEITVQGETFTSSNFGIKQQLYANQPLLIPLLFRQMLDTLGTVSIEHLLNNTITIFDEKQGALLSSSTELQRSLDQLYWSGKTISPTCVTTQGQCINDYLFTVDQDISNRVTSSYIQKGVRKSVRLSEQKDLNSTVEITWKNDSPLPPSEGGTYRTYTQLLLPGNAQIRLLTKNNIEMETYDSLRGKFTILGFYHEVAPGQASTISVAYTVAKKLRTKSHYQLVSQKQLGSPSLPFTVTISLPSNQIVTATNIDQVVNNSMITYNTILNTDKLFFVETQKK